MPVETPPPTETPVSSAPFVPWDCWKLIFLTPLFIACRRPRKLRPRQRRRCVCGRENELIGFGVRSHADPRNLALSVFLFVQTVTPTTSETTVTETETQTSSTETSETLTTSDTVSSLPVFGQRIKGASFALFFCWQTETPTTTESSTSETESSTSETETVSRELYGVWIEGRQGGDVDAI